MPAATISRKPGEHDQPDWNGSRDADFRFILKALERALESIWQSLL
jgi:hypothetical protein